MAHKIVRRGVEIDLSVVGKVGCPKCMQEGRDRSRDNLHLYGLDSDGEHLGGKCFSCNYLIPSEKWLEENRPITLEDMEYEMKGEEFNNEVHEGIKSITSFNSKNYRGITPETSRFFGVRYECDTGSGEIKASYYPVTRGILEGVQSSEAITGYKIRYHPKKFGAIGETGKESDLFGMFRFPTHKGIVVICAGEIDHLSAYQMLKDDYNARGNKRYDEVAVVSPTSGEGSINQFKRFYEWFNNFNKVIICYDNDKAGKIATEALAQVLPRGKVFVMPLRNKDVNEYVEKGMEREFISDFWAAKPYTPDGIKSSYDGFLEIKDELLKPRITLPPYMHKMEDMMGGGIQQGRIVNIIAATSSGKSTHANKMIHHWIFNSDLVPTIISLEATASQYNIDLLQTHLGINFTYGKTGEEVVEFLEQDWVQGKIRELQSKPDGSPRYYIIDERSGSIEEIESQMELMFKKHGSKLFLQDVITDLLRGSNTDKSEDHMAFQKRLVKDGATIINVHHTTKIPLDKDGKVRDVTEYDAFGTSSYVQSGAINIVLNRDKIATGVIERNTTYVTMPKCRGGKTGDAGKWFFDFDTSNVYDLDDYKRDNPHLFVNK